MDLRVRHVKRFPLAVLVTCLCCPVSVLADMAYTTVSGTSDAGDPVSANIALSWNGTDLIATIDNTSLDNSVITGFGLMGGVASTAAADFSASGTLNDSVWFAANGLALKPPGQFGTFDFGGDTPPPDLLAGDPNAGVEAGSVGTFSFLNLSSSYASALDFLTTTNDNELYSVVLRFQRVGPGTGPNSAKAGAFGGTRIPAPGAALLGFIGLGVVGGVKRRIA